MKKGQNKKFYVVSAAILGLILLGYIITYIICNFLPVELFYFWLFFILTPLILTIWEIFREKVIFFLHKYKIRNPLLYLAIVFFWLLELFCFKINECSMWIYLLGIVIIVIIISILIYTIFKEEKLPVFSIMIDLLIAVAITCNLIYRIPKRFCGLQEIVTSIVAALYGGVLTLMGVVLTIKRGEKNKSEEVHNGILPYIKILTGNKLKENIDNKIVIESLNKQNDGKKLDLKKQKNFFSDIFIKSISNSCIIIEKIEINDCEYALKGDVLLDMRESARIVLSEYNDSAETNKAMIRLYVKDSLGKEYFIDFDLVEDRLDSNEISSSDGKKDESEQVRYTAIGASLPKEIEVKKEV